MRVLVMSFANAQAANRWLNMKLPVGDFNTALSTSYLVILNMIIDGVGETAQYLPCQVATPLLLWVRMV